MDALRRACPAAPEVYGCPICLTGFDSPEDLTLEDVPPQSIGGKPLVLTCSRCNHTSGHELDVHIKLGLDLQEFAAGKRPLDARLTQFGQTVTAEARIDGDNVQLLGVRQRTDPKAHAAWTAGLESASAAGSFDWDVTVDFKTSHNARRETVAWLRVGYLYAFAALGYTFVMRPELDPVRQQILRPDTGTVLKLVKQTPSPKQEGIVFIDTPDEMRSIAVIIRNRIIFLPHFINTDGFYSRMEPVSEADHRFFISGKHRLLPDGPELALDVNPDLLAQVCRPRA